MLDNEATLEQERFFNSHIENCIICFSHYNVERQIRQLLKAKLKGPVIPIELAEEIRKKIVS
jgi:anti-sigma factor (TIGR02949 family)